jgi:hypothetical protein
MMTSVIQNDVYIVKDCKKFVSLYYKYRERGVDYYSQRKGSVGGWRRNVFMYGMKVFRARSEEVEYLPGVRMSILIRTLPLVRNRSDAFDLVDIVNEMQIEELSFWTWKLNVKRSEAAKAIKALYGVR